MIANTIAPAPDRRGARIAGWLRAFRPVAPLLVVNAFAVLGQYLAGVDNYSPAEWSQPARIAVALGAAVGVESVSLYVQWHAHDALLMGATATAARMRRAAYLIALGVAGISYHHFADGWQPTPAALVFAAFSVVSPWLWGLHTRRAHRIQLLREGQVDSTGAVFSAERWRAFPVRSWKARRWSIDYGVNDPREAWVGYKEHALKRPAPGETDASDGLRKTRDELAEQWMEDNPDGGARRLAAYLTENGYPLSPSGAGSAYLKNAS